MRRVSLKMLLMSCAALLLAMDGCSTESTNAGKKALVRGVAGEDGDRDDNKGNKGPPFRLPDDQAGRMLSDVLPPAVKSGHLRNPTPPVPPMVPWPRLGEPRLDLPGSGAIVSRLPQPLRKEQLRPRLVVEEGLSETLDEPALPRRPSFPVGRRTAVPSEDVAVPPPLPVMAQPVPDRVSLDDATAEASTAAVLTAPLPRRTTPAPFVRTRVPEPFGPRAPLTISIPAEESTPLADSPAAPKP